MDYVWFMKFWMDYVWMFKSWSFLVIKKSYFLYEKNILKNPWVPMDNSIPAATHIVGTHEGTGRVRVSYLCNGEGQVSYYPYS